MILKSVNGISGLITFDKQFLKRAGKIPQYQPAAAYVAGS